MASNLDTWILRGGLAILLSTTAYFNSELTHELRDVRSEAARSNKEIMSEIAEINIALAKLGSSPSMYSRLTEGQIGDLCIVSLDDE